MGGWNGWTWPNYNEFISNVWGYPPEVAGPGISIASNIVIGANPPYSVADFLTFYPNFGGAPLVLTGQTTNGSPVVTNTSTGGILPGMVVSPYVMQLAGAPTPGPFPDGTTVLSVDSDTQLTMSQPAILPATGSGFQPFGIYNAPFVPLIVMNAYVALASDCLVYNRWIDHWYIAMGYFIAHEITLWLRSSAPPIGGMAGLTSMTATQLAVQGLAKGIMTSKAAGGVSAGYQPSTTTGSGGLSSYGDLQETEYGIRLARLAQVIGGGPVWLY
jgi:hypothetical protein